MHPRSSSLLRPDTFSSISLLSQIGEPSSKTRASVRLIASRSCCAEGLRRSHSLPAVSRSGIATARPSLTSVTIPIDGGTPSFSGALRQENEPATACTPGLSLREGTPSRPTTATGLPSTVTSPGQHSASPGSGSQLESKARTSSFQVPPSAPHSMASVDGQTRIRSVPES